MMVICAVMGSLMFCSRVIMAVLPNIHLLGMLIMVLTLSFRGYALISIYIYVMIEGLYAGFALWWMPYLYIWTILWAITMILPKKMPRWLCCVVYPVVCSLFGFAFGILYAPGQALFFGLDWNGILTWMAAGVAFDVTHGISNFIVGLLIVPFTELIIKLKKQYNI